jgi:hypothetical protein
MTTAHETPKQSSLKKASKNEKKQANKKALADQGKEKDIPNGDTALKVIEPTLETKPKTNVVPPWHTIKKTYLRNSS